MNEIECHETFDTSSAPRTEQLKGSYAYAVSIEPETGATIACYAGALTEDRYYAQSGSIITRIATIGADGMPNRYRVDMESTPVFGTTADGYYIRKGDTLIVQANVRDLGKSDQLARMVGQDMVLLLPSGTPLPFPNGTDQDKSHRVVGYNITGIITADDRLITWCSAGGFCN